jgi:anti-anti-sigma regulatory factor
LKESDVPVILEQTETLNAIRLEGVIDICCAVELKTVLLQALGSGTKVHVSLEDAIDMDVTAFQLLWAAERAAKGSSVEFALAGRVPEQVSQALVYGGFGSFPMAVDAMCDGGVSK